MFFIWLYIASLLGMEYSSNTEPDSSALAVGRAARGMRESIIKGRSMLKMFFSLIKFVIFYRTGKSKSCVFYWTHHFNVFIWLINSVFCY